MDIQTKFNLNDSVWFMLNNKPTQAYIASVKTFNVGTDQDSIAYTARDAVRPETWLDHQHLHESTLYKTQIELIESLTGECKGIGLGDGAFSGCDQSAGDCPECGK